LPFYGRFIKKSADTQKLFEGFNQAGEVCKNATGKVFSIFMWLESKGTTYKTPTVG